MDHFQTKEGKLLYIIYNLYKQNKISIEQRHILKDLLIANDFRIKEILAEIQKEENISRIEKMIENIHTEEQSPRDIDDTLSNTYKNKRPKLFKFQKSNFSKFLETKASEDNDSYPSSKNLQQRQRVYSLAADSC